MKKLAIHPARIHIHSPANIGAKIADGVTSFFGTWLCLGLHTLWFALWFVFRLDVALLTNIVSLEAIGLAILIMMSQSRSSQKDRARDDLEAQEISEIFENHKLLMKINEQQLEMLELIKQSQLTRVSRGSKGT